MARDSSKIDIQESIGNLKVVLSLLYAVNVEAVSQETFERVCLMAVSLVVALEKGVERL